MRHEPNGLLYTDATTQSFWAAEDAAVQHMIGIGSMVERRGGMEKLGFNGYVKFAIARSVLSPFQAGPH